MNLAALKTSLLKTSWLRNGFTKVKLEDHFFLARQLHVLQKSGVPLLSSLQALRAQLPQGVLKRILGTVRQDLLEGHTLSQAMQRHPRAFSPVTVSLVRVGEAGGLLDEVLAQLARLYEWELTLRRRLQEALLYPTLAIGALVVAMIIMVTFVLPRFAQLFQSNRAELPFQTKLLMLLGHVVSQYGWVILILLVAAIAGWSLYLRTERGRLHWHTWKLRLPVLGPLFLQLSMSRFARTTAALNRSGVSIIETLALASQSVNNRHVQQRLAVVRDRVRGGEPLAQAVAREPLFPPVVVQMIATGEETGRIDELLHSVSEYYDQQVTFAVRRLITFVEPALLIIIGLGVLLMATAVLVPMWDLVRVFKRGG